MKNFFILCSLILFSVSYVYSALAIKIAHENPTSFQVGERAFVAVEIVTDDQFYTTKGTTISPYELTIISGNADWLYPQHRPQFKSAEELNTNDPQWHWENNQYFWMELSGIVPNTANGLYTGTVQVKNTDNGEIATAAYSFEVKPHNNNLSIIMYDAAASYNRQMEIRSYIRNNSNAAINLDRPYMDYYLTKDPNRQIVLNVWKKPTNACVQILDCGNDHYIIRNRYISNLTLNSRGESEEFQIGYNEKIDNNNSFYFDSIPEKDLIAFNQYNSYLDYSYAGHATNYTARAMRRNEFYNPYMALFETSSQTPLYGTTPSWVGSHCTVKTPVTATGFDAGEIRTYEGSYSSFCTDQFPNQPPVISFDSKTPDFIYEGEDYVAFPIVSDPDNDAVTLTLVNGPNWLEIGTPSNYDVDNWPHHPSVGNVYYVRSVNGNIRQQVTKEPNVYSYTIKASDGRGGDVLITKQIQVLHGTSHPSATNKKFAVLMGDETWFRKYQLDVATGIVNYSDNPVTLTDFYYEYYGSQTEVTTMKTPQYWYSHPEFTPIYTDCGEKRFRIRYQYNGSKTFQPHYSYFDNKAGLVYASFLYMNKMDDWSFVSDKIYRREYNANMPLYNGNGDLLWGSAPTWANQCDENGGSDPDTSTSVILKDSSPFRDLSVRFYDNYPDTNTMNFNADVYNKGTDTLSLSGYEMRFYFNDYKHYLSKSMSSDASKTQYASYYPPETFFADNTPRIDRCKDGKYVLKIKFNESATINPSSSYPSNGVIQGALYTTEGTFNKWYFASWINSRELKDNPNMALFDESGNLVYGREAFSCEEIPPKKLDLAVYPIELHESTINGIYGAGFYSKLSITNKGDSSILEPVYLEYYVRHTYGQVPVLFSGADTLSEQGKSVFLQQSGVYVERISAGDLHTYRFKIPEGLSSNSEKEISFTLYDACIYDCGTDYQTKSLFKWNYKDDWSVSEYPDGVWSKQSNPMHHVRLLDSLDHVLYGVADPSSASVAKPSGGDQKPTMTHSKPIIGIQMPNRTDAIAYSLGQLLSGGDFEDVTLPGWKSTGVVKSIRDEGPQGSRFLKLENATISQQIKTESNRILADSGAVLLLWHKGSQVMVSFAQQNISLNSSGSWRHDTLYFSKTLFSASGNYELKLSGGGNILLDDIVLIPGTTPAPSTYAVRFTTTGHEEMETRAYDGDQELLITTSVRDYMGRLWKKFLPFALPCSDVVDCNSSGKTLDNPTMAENYYIKANPDYPDAAGYPFVETRWKPDQAATKDVIGNPGKAYSLDGDSNGTHLVRAYSSGVNLTGINLLDFVSLDSVVSAVKSNRLWDGGENYHAARDLNPTHLWELSIDPDGRMAFTVKDGESKVVVSGALNSDGRVVSRSVSELDVRGNVIKSHPPLSCEYTPLPTNCVAPSSFEYDSESRVVKSVEPDANETRSYYDVAGRVRATQTQRQIDSGAVSVTGYDHIDRAIFTGVWKTSLDSSGLRSYFNDVINRNNPTISELEAGTVTRTYYDRMPSRDTLGVELYPEDLDTSSFKYNRGRVVATISDVYTAKSSDGSILQTTDGRDSVIRASVANVYDKRGRVIESYIYNGSVAVDSLKMVATATEYDLAGKILRVTKYPYGLSDGGKSRKVVERYSYDRLGRVDTLYVMNGSSPETVLAAYEYYPTGSVKSINMGNAITLDYQYHISGAVKSAVAYVSNDATSGSATDANSVPNVLYSESLYYEDCGDVGCTPQYNGNISRMAHRLAHVNQFFNTERNVAYYYDFMNRLTKVDDEDERNFFDEAFTYDEQGRITRQARAENAAEANGGASYVYTTGSNKLLTVGGNGGGKLSDRFKDNSYQIFIYDRDGNMIEDKSKNMTISYDYRGLPVAFNREVPSISGDAGQKDSVRLLIAYDGAGSRISKIRERKSANQTEWNTELSTHYTGIGSEIRVNGLDNTAKVVINLPQGLGRYQPEDAKTALSSVTLDENGKPTDWNVFNPKYEWYLKNHLGSTMLVYGTNGNEGSLKSAYDYRAFGEQVDLTLPVDKVTETFTGKELDDETELSYFGARYLDQMLGMWVSVDAKRQHYSPYEYGSNNPIVRIDPDGNADQVASNIAYNLGLNIFFNRVKSDINTVNETSWIGTMAYLDGIASIGQIGLKATAVFVPDPRVRSAANAALVGLDALVGYTENGLKGTGLALGTDIFFGILSSKLPDGLVSRFAQTVVNDVVLEGGKEMFSNNLNVTEPELMIENPQAPADNTSVNGN